MPAKKIFVTGLKDDTIRLICEAHNNLVDSFNAHTHKTPTTAPGATSTPTSDAGAAGSTGGTAFLSDEKIFDTLNNVEI